MSKTKKVILSSIAALSLGFGCLALWLYLLDEPAMLIAEIDYGSASAPGTNVRDEFQRILARRETIFGYRSHCLIEPLSQLSMWESDDRKRTNESPSERSARIARAMEYSRRALDIATEHRDGAQIRRFRGYERLQMDKSGKGERYHYEPLITADLASP